MGRESFLEEETFIQLASRALVNSVLLPRPPLESEGTPTLTSLVSHPNSRAQGNRKQGPERDVT